jgi:NADH-quinone oxidoreductase subunit N
MLFLGLEVMSIAVYVLAGLFREDPRSNEASLKYLILGAFSSAFLLFGMAFLYGAAGGTLYLDQLPGALMGHTFMRPLTLLAMALLLVGFGFKVASAPFHMWTPDVYEGAPTSVTAFMAVGVKAAAFAAFARVFFLAFLAMKLDWTMLLWVLAVATMTVGNVTAIVQTNIKRMLAYSSIAHAGYLLVALVAANQLGAVSLLYYLLAYTLMNLGAFGVVILVGRKKDSYLSIYDYSGLGFQHPALAASMALFMFALAGIPPTAGFVGKFYIFSAAVQAGYIWLAIIGVMNSLVSVFYYLRITVLMYMRPAEADLGPVTFSPGPTAVLASCAKIKPLNQLLNQKFLPQFLEGENKNQFINYLRTWCDLGVPHIQFNVVDRATLLDAQKHPEKHSNLIVRVAGYSTYFVDLSKGLQDHIIARTEQQF